MATSFEFGRFGHIATSGTSELDGMVFESVVSEVVSADATNKQTTAVAPGTGGGRAACRIATDAAVYVAFGQPTADSKAAGKRLFMPANSSMVVYVNAGDKGACSTS